MIETALFHLLAATAGAAFGLLAVWAALGRVYWFVRFLLVAAVIGCLFPVPAFDLALVFVSQALVVAVTLIFIHTLRVPPTADGESQSPPGARNWRHFSVADLFKVTCTRGIRASSY